MYSSTRAAATTTTDFGHAWSMCTFHVPAARSPWNARVGSSCSVSVCVLNSGERAYTCATVPAGDSSATAWTCAIVQVPSSSPSTAAAPSTVPLAAAAASTAPAPYGSGRAAASGAATVTGAQRRVRLAASATAAAASGAPNPSRGEQYSPAPLRSIGSAAPAPRRG